MTTATAAPPLTGRWEIDPGHSTVEFRARHAGLARVRGQFHDFAGVLEVAEDGTMTGRGTIETVSLDTRLGARDSHLRSADFLDVVNHPRMEFVATAMRVQGSGLTVEGELTIRGVTRPIELHGELYGTGRDDDGADRAGLALRGHLDRRDYGLTWNTMIDGGGLLVGNRVDLEIELSAVRIPAPADAY